MDSKKNNGFRKATMNLFYDKSTSCIVEVVDQNPNDGNYLQVVDFISGKEYPTLFESLVKCSMV
jgi:hypothetical protein